MEEESAFARAYPVGINFQKASSTLDGCVKIWTSRVDSVATETGKLLSGLAGGEFSNVRLIRLLKLTYRREWG